MTSSVSSHTKLQPLQRQNLCPYVWLRWPWMENSLKRTMTFELLLLCCSWATWTEDNETCLFHFHLFLFSGSCVKQGWKTICTYEGYSYIPHDMDPDVTHLVMNNNNRVSSLRREDFAGYPKMINIKLSNNEIEYLVEDVFCEMPKLRSISLWNNNIRFIDVDALNCIPNLVNLHLGMNELHNIPSGVFCPVPKLQWLALSNNKIDYLDPNLFQCTHELVRLYLNRNPLGSLHHKIFDNLHDLEVLSLMKTGLTSLPLDIFEDCFAKYWLDLRGNQLTSFSPMHIQNFPGTVGRPLILEIGDNPLECCPMLWLKEKELAGTVIWWQSNNGYKSPPQCTDVPWDQVSAATCSNSK